jgi:hypothetical protein
VKEKNNNKCVLPSQKRHEMAREMLDALPVQLELDEQRDYDQTTLQRRDDILHHMNAETERIIAAFGRLDHGDLEDNSDHYDHNDEISEDSCHYPPMPPGDDVDENTDTEDGADDVIELIEAHMKLLAFLSKQSATIARLRARIARLSEFISKLTIPKDSTHNIRDNSKADSSSDDDEASQTNDRSSGSEDNGNIRDSTQADSSSNNDHNANNTRSSNGDNGYKGIETKRMKLHALVLMDTDPDVTLSTISSKFNSDIHLSFLANKRIHREKIRQHFNNTKTTTCLNFGCTSTLEHPGQ